MAYTFDRTLNLLGDQNQGKTNIFNLAGDTSTTTPTSTPQFGTDIKTSVEGAISTQPKTSGAGAQQALQRSSLVAPKSGVLKANVGKTQAPKSTQTALTGIKTAGENLQGEADQYLADATTYQAPSQERIKKAVGGDAEAQKEVTGTLQRNVQDPEAFKPKTDIQIESAGELTTPQGVHTALAREGGEEYTRGMGNLDLALLSQSPDFAQTLEAIGRGQRELYGQADTASREVTAERGRRERDSAETAKDFTSDALTDLSKGIVSQSEGEARNAQNQLLYYQGKYSPTPQEKARWDKDREDWIKTNVIPKVTGYGKSMGFGEDLITDYSPYMTYGGNYSYKDFITPEESQQFNTIMSMLGLGDSLQASMPGKSMFEFNAEQAYRDYYDAEQGRLADEAAASTAKEEAFQDQVQGAAKDALFNFPRIGKTIAPTPTVPGGQAPEWFTGDPSPAPGPEGSRTPTGEKKESQTYKKLPSWIRDPLGGLR